MRKPYLIALGITLGITVGAELYFGTIFNESVRHILDVPALLFVAPGLLINHLLRLGLPFDGPNHSSIIWISGFVYATITAGAIAVVRAVRNRLQLLR